MTAEYTLPLTDPGATVELVGGKGASLARLASNGFPVPDGFHVTTAAYREVVSRNNLLPSIQLALDGSDLAKPSDLEAASRRIRRLFDAAIVPIEIVDAVVGGYASLAGTEPAVAVRSSATAEDLPQASFAGQQETLLNLRGAAAVVGAIRTCWSSLWTARAIAYRLRQGIDQRSVELAVVVQLLVPAQAAGVLFTVDPVTGDRGRSTITACWGLGETVVGGAVTPDWYLVDRSTGTVLRRQIADKLVMTVCDDGGTRQSAVPDPLRRAATLDDRQAAELAALGARIEQLYGTPMDIEWTLCQGALAVVQARPITTLTDGPLEWTRPDPKGVYMRSSVVDLMPYPLSPLFVTLGMQSLMAQMSPLARRVTRSEPVLPEDYYTTINNYGYVNTTLPARSWWWMLTRVIPAYPRMLRSVVSLWRDEMHPEYQAAVSRLAVPAATEMASGELWRGAQEAVSAAMRYVVSLLFATMGASAGSEMLLTALYNRMVRREGDPQASALLMGWDNTPVRAEKSLYDLAGWCREHSDLSPALLGQPSRVLAEKLRTGAPPAGADPADWTEFSRRFGRHLASYGHIVYQLDFAEPIPRDDPAPMVEALKMYLRGEGADPHERQRASEEKRRRLTSQALARLRGFKRWAMEKALGWAQPLAEAREDALADIGLGYPVIRERLRELGRRLAAAGVIERADDIYYLERAEIDESVARMEDGLHPDAKADRVEARRAFHKKAAQSTPPPTIPARKRIMGIKTEVFAAVAEDDQTGNTLKGVPTSAGTVTAEACVLRGPDDFDAMKPGAVLVAGTTTPAWTPLFAMASGVVTDIGGPHSHGSIVAREYGIPAVMGTGVATRRIRSGQTITVDGSAGTVTLGD